MASRSISKTTARPRATKAKGASSKPDPIFAAMAAHDKACAAIMTYCDRAEDIPDKVALARYPELRALGRTVPQTPEGVRALGTHVAKWWHNFFNDVADPDIRRMFKSLAKAMPTPRAAKASEPVIDPTTAAIATFEKAWAAFETLVGEEQRLETKLRPIEAKLGVDISTHRPSYDIGIPYARFETDGDVRKYFAKQRKDGPPLSFAPISKTAWTKQCARQQKDASKRLRKRQRDLKRLQDKHGWTNFERRYDAASLATGTALEKLVRTTPTTFEGLATLSAWASDNYEEHLEGTRWNATELLFDTITRSAKRLAGGRS